MPTPWHIDVVDEHADRLLERSFPARAHASHIHIGRDHPITHKKVGYLDGQVGETSDSHVLQTLTRHHLHRHGNVLHTLGPFSSRDDHLLKLGPSAGSRANAGHGDS